MRICALAVRQGRTTYSDVTYTGGKKLVFLFQRLKNTKSRAKQSEADTASGTEKKAYIEI